MACSSVPKQVLPQVGPRAVPEIFLADRPTFTPLTQEEFDKTPITVKGKILKFTTDTTAFCDIADAAVQGYRSYIQSLFDKDAAPEVAPGVPATPVKKGYQFWK